MRTIAALFLACCLAACSDSLAPAPEPGDVIRLVRHFTLSQDDEDQLVISQDLVVTVEDAHTLDVRCEAVRVWIGAKRGPADFDSAESGVEDVLALDEGDMAAVYAATWAGSSLVRLGVRVDDAMRVEEVSVREGLREDGAEEEDALHAVLAVAVSDPASLLSLLQASTSPAIGDTREVRELGERVACAAAYRGVNAWGDGVEGRAWAGDARVRGPARVRAGRLTINRSITLPDRVDAEIVRLSVTEDDGEHVLLSDVSLVE